jgi:5''-nucleotidase, lipoprotein e(P4) family
MNLKKNQGLRGAGFILALIVSAYSGATFLGHSSAQQTAPAPDNEYMVGATLWQQTAAEYRALTYQSFNYARLLFDKDLKTMRRNKRKRAVVVDVDDTVLDNSRYQAALVLRRNNYGASAFTEWCKVAEATPVPGALEFLKYAHAKGARIFYVSNRRQEDKGCTSENLKKFGFPDVSDETLLFRMDTSSKEARRQLVDQKHRTVLLIGDNLNDLAQVFERKPIAERFAAVDRMRNEFGSRFIVIPNAMYGEWESAIYEYQNLSDADRALKRRSTLKDF